MKVADRILDINQALEKKINICLATDGFCTAGTFSVVEEAKKVFLRGVKLAQKNISAQKIFDMITINAAHALGLKSSIGSIEIGKKADLSFWSAPPFNSGSESLLDGLLSGSAQPELQSLIIDGKIIIWYKELLVKSEKEIINKFRTLTTIIKKLRNENNIS
jgi:5-methylthioadenosine/S-adenosylhomocysteine deaminase